MNYQERLKRLLDAATPTIPYEQTLEVEEAVIAATEAHAPKDEAHKVHFLNFLKALDAEYATDHFQSERVKAAYEKLLAAPAELFWTKGLVALKKLRTELHATA